MGAARQVPQHLPRLGQRFAADENIELIVNTKTAKALGLTRRVNSRRMGGARASGRGDRIRNPATQKNGAGDGLCENEI